MPSSLIRRGHYNGYFGSVKIPVPWMRFVLPPAEHG
jgi:hypothetical protein